MTELTPKNNEFYIVDFDRTLADSDKLLEVFIEVAEEYSAISREQIQKADQDVKLRGDSFDTASYVREQLNRLGKRDDWPELEKRFIHESRSLNYSLPGANELLGQLALKGYRHGILTYGDSLWQGLKLTAAGFNHVRHIITAQKEKSLLIQKWQQPDGSFAIPHDFGGGTADSVVMIDDKAVSFDGFPGAPSKGFWVVDKDNMLPSQQGTVPGNVVWYSDLNDIVADL